MDIKDRKTVGHIVCLVLSIICPPLGVIYGLVLLGNWYKGSKWYTAKDRLREEKLDKWIKEHLGVG